jgi:UDP-2,3-diacylglucosamine pyrophosphatase LpxH
MSAERHYLVVSDLHLADVEDHPDGWKEHKSSRRVFDGDFDTFVASFEARVGADDSLTLILNGDIFDFDLVTAVPDPSPFPISPLERRYGLDATAPRSAWKMARILDDHPRFVATLGRLVGKGHRVVVVMGNHDRELVFSEVQDVLRTRVLAAAGDTGEHGRIDFEPWFFHVPGDVYIEHGHQYDFYSSFSHNLDPTVEKDGETHIALPTGNLSNRYLLSNIGFFNPHATDFILDAVGYLAHWLRHYAFTRRALILTWLVGSVRSLLALLDTRARIARHPPKDYERHIDAAAVRNQVAPETARALYALRKEPITSRVFKIVREFWLDRVLLALAMTIGTVILALSGAPLWTKLVVPLAVMPLLWFVYQWIAGNENALTAEYRSQVFAASIAKLVPVRAVVFGHTHAPTTVPLSQDVVFANSGTWAPTWDSATGAPVAGLHNYVHIAIDDAGQRTANEAGQAVPDPTYLDACRVTAGSWLPLEPVAPDWARKAG